MRLLEIEEVFLLLYLPSSGWTGGKTYARGHRGGSRCLCTVAVAFFAASCFLRRKILFYAYHMNANFLSSGQGFTDSGVNRPLHPVAYCYHHYRLDLGCLLQCLASMDDSLLPSVGARGCLRVAAARSPRTMAL